MRPRLLDLYCCEGGAAKGYTDAGFDVTGVDVFTDYSQRRYPYRSHKSDAVAFVREYGYLFDAVHASPPCQHASAGTRAMRARGDDRHPALIEPTRDALDELAALRDPLWLCGTMFGLTATDDDGTPLEMWRHRGFESNVPLTAPGPCQHGAHSRQVAGSYGGARRDKVEAREVRGGGYVPSKRVQSVLLGIDWMTERGMHQSLPPAYTKHVGRQLLEHLAGPRPQVVTA